MQGALGVCCLQLLRLPAPINGLLLQLRSVGLMAKSLPARAPSRGIPEHLAVPHEKRQHARYLASATEKGFASHNSALWDQRIREVGQKLRDAFVLACGNTLGVRPLRLAESPSTTAALTAESGHSATSTIAVCACLPETTDTPMHGGHEPPAFAAGAWDVAVFSQKQCALANPQAHGIQT